MITIIPELPMVLNFLIQNKKTLSVAESFTGGLLSYMLTSLPGSSAVFKEGIVTYSIESKCNRLGITVPDIIKYGVVSSEIAKQMANYVKFELHTDFGIGITGNAGPTVNVKETKVGEVYIGFSSKTNLICSPLFLKGTRAEIREKAVEETISLFWKFLKRELL